MMSERALSRFISLLYQGQSLGLRFGASPFLTNEMVACFGRLKTHPLIGCFEVAWVDNGLDTVSKRDHYESK